MDQRERYKVIKSKIRAHAERVAWMQDLGDDEQPASEWVHAGLDSPLSMVELRNALQRELGEAMRLSSPALFDYPCLEALAHHIDLNVFSESQSTGGEVTLASVPGQPPQKHDGD
eukprot:720316-Rhodomonas_salina.2